MKWKFITVIAKKDMLWEHVTDLYLNGQITKEVTWSCDLRDLWEITKPTRREIIHQYMAKNEKLSCGWWDLEGFGGTKRRQGPDYIRPNI